MTRSPSHSFCWAFCLSFACLFTWFIPVEALFSAPLPRPTDDGGTEFSASADHLQIPKQLVKDHEAVFGDSILEGPWARKSGSAWDGLAPHLFVSLEGPCVYNPVTEIDITADVHVSAPNETSTRFISTTGWLTGPQGTFPVRFAVASDEGMSLFFFTGMAPSQLFIEPLADFGDGTDSTGQITRCDVGVTALAGCDDQLDSALADEGTPSAASLRMLLASNQEAIRDCWRAYAQSVQDSISTRDLALQTARENRNTAITIAQLTALLCFAATEAALLICLASAMGWSFFGLVIITAAQALTCAATAALAGAVCAAALPIAMLGINAAYNSAVDAANAAFEIAMNSAKATFEHCLEIAKRKSSKSACALIPNLSPTATAAIEDHRDCYRAAASEHYECLSSTGDSALLEHGLHLALDSCAAAD